MCESLKIGGIYGYGIRTTLILLFQTIFFMVSVVNLTYLGQGKLNRGSAFFRLACGHFGEAFLSLLNKYINVQPTAISGIFKHVSLEFIKKVKVVWQGRDTSQSAAVLCGLCFSCCLQFLIWRLYMLTVHCKPDKPFIVFYTCFFFFFWSLLSYKRFPH